MWGEILNVFAIILTTTAVGSGLFAVGRQETWDFPQGIKPYLQGNSRALLYALIVVTSCVSVAHFAFMLDWFIFDRGEGLSSALNVARLVWHCIVALSFIGMHMWAKFHRQTRRGQPDRFFWGAGRGST